MGNSAIKLGSNLRRIRQEKGMSQVDLANELKVNKSYVSNIENNKSNPTLSTMEKLANLLEINVGDLLG